MSEIAPGFLVAVPQLGDENFARAIILMIEHSPDGALGIVVNRPSHVKLGEVARTQGMPARPEADKQIVMIGGPVQPERGFLLHDRTDLTESVHLLDALYVSSSLDSLRTLLGGPPDKFRLCLGYAGWGPGQLERELQAGAWIVAPATLRHVLETPAKQVWEQVLRDMGIDPAMLLHSGGLH